MLEDKNNRRNPQRNRALSLSDHNGGNRSLQAPELKPVIEAALAMGLSLMPSYSVNERIGVVSVS
jgi:hypothetical protein